MTNRIVGWIVAVASYHRPNHWLYLASYTSMFFVGVILIQVGRPLPEAFGVSLAGAGAAGWFLYVYVLASQRTAERLELLTRFGFVKAFSGRSVAIRGEYDARLSHAGERIDIMGYGLRALREDYRTTFRQWRDRASVRILLLDPHAPSQETPYSTQRDTEEHNAEGSIAQDVYTFVRFAKDEFPNDDRFELRLYRTIPSVNIFRIDDECFWGPYFVGGQSRNMPTFIVSRGGTMYSTLITHFESIWNSDEFSRPAFDLLLEDSE